MPNNLHLEFVGVDLPAIDLARSDPEVWTGSNQGLNATLAYIEHEESFTLSLSGIAETISRTTSHVAVINPPWVRFDMNGKVGCEGKVLRVPIGWQPDRYGGSPMQAGVTI